MDHRATRGVSKLGIGLAAFTGLLTTAIAAQDPAAKADEPVRRALETFKKEIASKAPAERLKAYEEGVELVKKSGVVESALKVGDKAPEFELANASGKMVKLSSLLADGPVIVTWYRGGWCPYCNIALRGFQKVLARDQGGRRQPRRHLAARRPTTPAETVTRRTAWASRS